MNTYFIFGLFDRVNLMPVPRCTAEPGGTLCPTTTPTPSQCTRKPNFSSLATASRRLSPFTSGTPFPDAGREQYLPGVLPTAFLI